MAFAVSPNNLIKVSVKERLYVTERGDVVRGEQNLCLKPFNFTISGSPQSSRTG